MAYEYVGYNEYPKMIYHATEGAKVVADRAEQETYGEGWQETPVTVDADAPAEPEKAKRGRKPKAEAAEPEAATEAGKPAAE